MKSRRNNTSEENRAAAASLLADLEEEYSTTPASVSTTAEPSKQVSAVKVGTNQEQSGNKPGTSSEIKWEQSGNKPGTKWEQNKTGSAKSGNKVGAQPGTEVGTNWEPTGNKVGTNRDVSTVIGLQRRVLDFFYRSCLNARTHHTERLPVERIAHSCQTTVQSAKVTIRRLEVMSLVKRLEYKDGRGGWTVYGLPDTVHSYLRLEETGNKVGTNQEQSGNKVGAQPGTQPRTSPSSSSSVLNIKKITTTEPVDLEWQKIDLGPSEGLGLSRYHITRSRELYPNLDPVSIQKLIYGFERHLSLPENKKTIRNPGAFFLSLAEKLSKGESPLPEYKNPDDELIEKLQAAAAAKLKKHQERLNALQTTVFENWWCETKDAEKSNLVASGPVKGEMYKVAVKARWSEEVWPETPEAQSLKEIQIDA